MGGGGTDGYTGVWPNLGVDLWQSERRPFKSLMADHFAPRLFYVQGAGRSVRILLGRSFVHRH